MEAARTRLARYDELQGHLAHEKHPPPRNLQKGLSRVLWWPWGGVLFFMSEVPLYLTYMMSLDDGGAGYLPLSTYILR